MRKLHALLLAVLLTLVFGTVYGTAQQYGRSSANDAPVALAQSVASQLSAGVKPASLAGAHLNLRTSLSPFFVVYDTDRLPVAGTGYLNGQLARIDSSVFDHAVKNAYHTVTWQPQPGVRVASVETATDSYYVLAGQSLRPTEHRADMLLRLVVLGWFASVVCVAIAYMLLLPRPKRKSPK